MEKIPYNNQLEQELVKIPNIKYYINSILLNREIKIHVNKIELIKKYIEIVILLNNKEEGIRKKIIDDYTYYHKCTSPRTSTISNEILVDSWNLYNESCRLFILFNEEKKNINIYQKDIVDIVHILTNLRNLQIYYDKQQVYKKFASMKFTQHYKKVNQVTFETNYTSQLNRLFPNILENMHKIENMHKRNSSRSSSIRSSSTISRSSSTSARTNF